MFWISDAVEDYMNDEIQKNLVMDASKQKERTESYLRWTGEDTKNAPITITTYYVYNITNPYQVLQGSYPLLKKIGPFVYRRFEYKRNVTFNEDSTIANFRIEYDFIYDEYLSSDVYSRSDMVYVLNPTVLTLLKYLSSYNNTSNMDTLLADSILQGGSAEPMDLFYNKTIQELLDGVCDTKYSDCPTTFFSILTWDWFNASIMTGNDNLNNLGILLTYRNVSYAQNNLNEPMWGYWDDIQRNRSNSYKEMVEGSHERHYAPKKFVKGKDTNLTIWSLEKYRKAKYIYRETITRKGLELYRYRISDEMWQPASINPSNLKYNQLGEYGLCNVSSVRVNDQLALLGGPRVSTVTFISKGNLLDAEYYINESNKKMGLENITADFYSDDQYFEVEPVSGIAFYNHHSFQLNTQIYPVFRPYQHPFENVSCNCLVPSYYYHIEGYPSDDIFQQFVDIFKSVQLLQDLSMYGGPAFAAFFFVIAIFIYWKRRKIINNAKSYSKLNDDYVNYGGV